MSDVQWINNIRSIRKKVSTFGYRLITDELRDAHAVMGENREHRLCRENMLYSGTIRPKRGSGKTPGPAVDDDLLKRNFTASRVNETWLLDITAHGTNSGKLYLRDHGLLITTYRVIFHRCTHEIIPRSECPTPRSEPT